MSRNELNGGEIALLGRLNRRPLELGDLPQDAVARLLALGLARKVLGFCEITRTGQLAVHRNRFRKASHRRMAHVTRRNPLYLQETKYLLPGAAVGFSDSLNRRYRVEKGKRAVGLPRKWLARLVAGKDT